MDEAAFNNSNENHSNDKNVKDNMYTTEWSLVIECVDKFLRIMYLLSAITLSAYIILVWEAVIMVPTYSDGEE